MSSKRQKKKGWLLPSTIEGHDLVTVCLKIPNDDRHRAAFRGAVNELTKWWNWEKTFNPGDTRASQCATYWRALLYEWLEIPCQGENFLFDLRQNPDEPCHLEKTHDGVLWELAFDYSLCSGSNPASVQNYFNTQISIQTDIYNSYDGVNPSSIHPDCPDTNYDGDGSDARQAALCMALQAWVTTIAGQFVTKCNQALGLSAVIVFLGSLLGPLGGVAGAVVAASLIYISLEAKEAAEDEDAVRDVICCMNDALQGAAITFAGWQTALNSCGFSPGSNQQIFADVVGAELGDEKNWTAFCNALGQAWTYAQAGVSDCPCDALRWIASFDFTVSQAGFTATEGTYVPGEGFRTGNVGGTTKGTALKLWTEVDPITIVQFEETWADFTYGGSGWSNGLWSGGAYSEVCHRYPQGSGTYSEDCNQYNRERINLFFRTSRSGYGGQATLSHARIWGVGPVPAEILADAYDIEYL